MRGNPIPPKKSGGARPLSCHAHSLVELVLAWLDGDWVPTAMARDWVGVEWTGCQWPWRVTIGGYNVDRVLKTMAQKGVANPSGANWGGPH
jgi:hypothetical protein